MSITPRRKNPALKNEGIRNKETRQRFFARSSQVCRSVNRVLRPLETGALQKPIRKITTPVGSFS